MKNGTGIIFILTAFSLILFFAACGNDTYEQEKTQLQQDVQKAIDKLDTHIEELESDMQNAGEDAAEEIQQRIDKLEKEQKNGKTVLKSEDKKHTIMNLVKKYLWKTGSEAGYDQGHPYLGGSGLVINSDTPSEDVDEAVSLLKEDLEDFRQSLKG